MDIFGSYTFNAPINRVWDLLMDPNAISSKWTEPTSPMSSMCM